MTDGLSLLELADLPAAWRTILRLLMREQPLTYAALVAAVANLPDAQRLQGNSLDEALTELVYRGYLIQQIIDGSRSFSAKIARKSGRTLSRAVWDVLDTPDNADPNAPAKPADPDTPRRRSRTDLWDSLG